MDTTLHLTAHLPAERAEEVQEVTSLQTREDFERAVTPLFDRLYRFCMVRLGDPTRAEDLLQASLIRAYTHRASYQGRGSILGWLFQIIRHEHAEQARRAARQRSLMEVVRERVQPWMEDWWGEDATPEAQLETQVAAHVLLECIQALPEAYRDVVHLCDMEEMSIEEVGALLNIPSGTVKSRHARGRARLATLVRARLEEVP